MADAIESGGDSPALEKYRQHRAELAELDVAERRRHLVRREVIHQHLTRFASIIRQAGHDLQKSFGSDAVEIISEAIDAAEYELSALHYGQTSDNTTATAAASD
jgi:hypothetical protein